MYTCKYGLDKLLREKHLWTTLTHLFPYNKNVIREFYANISAFCGDPDSPRFGKVYVCGKVYTFTPEVINDVFSLPNIDIPVWGMNGHVEKALVSEITGGKLKKWDVRFQSIKLTCKYVVLHKIAIACWMLSKNTSVLTKDQAIMIYRVGKGLHFNLGQFAFNATMKASNDLDGSLSYPNIIFQVLKSQ